MTESTEPPETPSRPVRWSYGRSQDGSILLYAGNLLLMKEGNRRHVQGDLKLYLGSRPALRVHLAGADPWIADLAVRESPPVLEVPEGATLEPPHVSAVPARPDRATSWANSEFWINQLTAGDLGSADRLVLYLIGRLTDWPLPRVETDEGSQGQVSFSLPGWDLRLAAIDQLASEADLSFVIEAVPQSKPISSAEAQMLIRRVHLLMSFLGAGGSESDQEPEWTLQAA